MRTRSHAVALLTAAVLVAPLGWVLTSSPAGAADPNYPTAGQVQRAKQAAAAKAAQVKQLQAQLAGLDARLNAAQTALSVAAEAYDGAQIVLAQRTQAARLAAANARRAAASFRAARTDVGRLAVQAYQDGGDLAALDALLNSSGPQDVLDRAAIIQDLASRQTRVLQVMDSSRMVAGLLQQQADAALRQQRQAAAALAADRVKAQAAAAASAAAVAQAQAQQSALTAQLAHLQQVSVTLERQRQAALRALAEAAARAAAARRARELAGSGAPVNASGSSQGTAAGGLVAVAWARQQLGLPYQWGGAGPGSYDCSGLTMRAWQQAGVSLPHFAAWQYEQAEKIPYGQMRPGDLIFYATDTSAPATIHHVTMYIGGGMMIEAYATGWPIRITSIRWGDGIMPWAGRP